MLHSRSTKASGKLKILPEEPEESTTPSAAGYTAQHQAHLKSSGDDDDEESSEDEDEGDEQRAKISKQLELARIPEGSMRRDARRITRKGRASLPRVTAYSTAT